MPFDPNSAVLAKPSFDPSTARGGFDPETATEARTAVFGGGTKLKPDTAPEYTLASALRGLSILGRNYAPAALQVHEADQPSEFLKKLMPGIEAPDISIPVPGSPINFNPSIAVAPINALSNTVVGLSNPEMAPIVSGMGAVSAAGRLIPTAQKIAQIAEIPIQAYFAADMTKGAMEGAKRTGELAADPNATFGQALQSGLETGATALFGTGAALGAVGGVRSIASTPEGRAVLSRIADKTPEQAVKTMREAKAATEDVTLANALTDAADALEREIAANDAQQKALDSVQASQGARIKAAQDIQKAQAQDAANAAKMQEEAAKPPEIPKSTQILAEQTQPKAIANVATEIGTQTSPFAVQAKINELTQIAPVGELGAPAAPVAEITKAPTEAPLGASEAKATQIKQAVKNAADYQFTVFRPGEGLPDAIQVDAIGPKGEALGSSNVADLNKAGARLPEVPDWVPQGKYTLEQMNALIERGAPERIFYRGTNPESTQRINEPFDAANGKTFAARTPEGAAQYGSSIEEIRAKPEAKILSDDTPEFWRVIGRKRPPNGYIGSSGKTGESLVSVVNGAIRKAEAAGYDAISIGDADIGTVILNEKAFTRTKGEPTNALQEPSPREILQREPSQTGEAGGERGRVEQGQQGAEAAAAVNAGNEVRQEPLPESLKPRERIVSAALRDVKTGKIFTGATHGMANIDRSVDVGGDSKNVGFMTDTGRYITQEEAAALTGGAAGSEEMAFYLKNKEVFDEQVGSLIADGMKRKDAVKAINDKIAKRDREEAAGKSMGELTEFRRANGFDDDGNPVGSKYYTPPKVEPPNLKLPAQMKRPELRAELSAAGAKDIAGVPLEDANAAQLMNAVGKLRRGQLFDEPKPGLVSGSKAEKWADKIIREGRGKVRSGLDPEELSAHTIKLIAQLERGAVDFAQWSAEKIKEVGEVIRPYLQQIWDTAHAQLETQRTMSGDDRGVSKSALGKYDYIKTTNKGQIEAAQPILNYVKQTGDFNGGFARLAQIDNTADRGVAAAVLLREAESIDDPYLRDRVVARLAREAKNAGTDAAQGLQAQGTVNDILEPYRGHLAWMDIIQSKLREKIEPIFGTDAANKVNAGFKEAGNRAAAQIDAPGAASLLSGPIARIKKASEIDWRAVFTDLPEKQAERKAEIFNRIKADPKISSLPPETQAKLASAMEAAWEHLRNNIFRQDFSKLVPLPNIPAPDRIKLEETLPELTKQANLGLLDNEAFLNAMADRYGIDRLDSTTGAKLRELGQKAARTPEGSERNEVFQEILDTIMKSRGVKPFDFLTDFWYRNVMSAPRTAVEIGAGGIIQGAARTFLTAADTAIAQGRPDIAFLMTAMFLRDMGAGVVLGADLIRTGDRTSLPRYTEQFLAKMDRLEKGKSPGGEIESLYRRSSGVKKAMLAPMEMVGRALTALDYIGGQGVRQQQMLYAALTRGDKKSFDAAMKQFDSRASVEAWRQARKELPQGRTAQILARAREIMNQDINADILKFGNQMTEVTALNATPAAISGLIYRGAAKLPMWVRAPTGLGFVKAALNLVQEYSNYAPVTGQINALRTMLPQIKSENVFNKALSLSDLPPERRRQIIAAQATGLAIMAAAANRFLRKQPGDDQNKPREWEISGSWMGLTPTQKSALMSAGEKPYAIKLPSGRWIDYKLTPYLPALAMIGHVRDQERFNAKKWTEEEIANKVGNAWLGGLAAIKDLSLASQFSDMAGILAADDKDPDMANSLVKKLADTVGNAATGLIPMNSMLREIDNYTDPQRYRADRKNPGVDLWLKQIPFARRTVGEGPMLNFLGEPVKVPVTPFNRHIGELPSTNPVERALSDKVSMGMKLPSLSQDTSVVGMKDGKPEQRSMTPDENYFYQKSVRQAFARQLASNLPAFESATPDQAALYSQAVFSNAERYVRDRMNLNKPFDGVVPADPRLSSALTGAYQQAKELNTNEASPSALAASKLRVEYDRLRALPDAQKAAEYRRVAQEDPQFAIKLIQYAQSPAAERTALEKAEAALEPESKAKFVGDQMKVQTPDQQQQFRIRQFSNGLINAQDLIEMKKQGVPIGR